MVRIGSKFLSISSAIITFLSLISLLVTVYVQQQSYQFIDSNRGIQENLFTSSSSTSQLDEITSLDMVWNWIDGLVERFAPSTIKDIDSNCDYQVNRQTVVIDGIHYLLFDPTLQIQSCYQNIFYVRSQGIKRKVYVTGNNQILSFGMFMKRSYPKYSVRGSSGEIPMTISSEDTYETPNARYDPKFIEVCSIRSEGFPTSASSYRCVLSDGFQNEPGSTLDWVGEEMNSVMTFQNESKSYLYLKGHSSTLIPCHTLSPSGQISRVTISNNATISWTPIADTNQLTSFTNCSLIWLTSGNSIRSKCLHVFNHQFTSRDSFMGAILGGTTVTSIYDLHFDCTNLVKYPLPLVSQWFYQSQDTIRVHLTLPNHQKFYGNFFSASDEFIWLGEGISLSTLLQFHDYLDKNTREFKIFLVLRNLGDNELFYSLITLTFHISSTGYMTNSYSSIFIPIIQYDYGLNGSPWLSKDVAISEFFLAFVLLLLLLKIAYQLSIAIRDGVIPRLRQIRRIQRRKSALRDEISSFSSHPTWRSRVDGLWRSLPGGGRWFSNSQGILPTHDIDEKVSPEPLFDISEQEISLSNAQSSQTTELTGIEMSSGRGIGSLFPVLREEEEDKEEAEIDGDREVEGKSEEDTLSIKIEILPEEETTDPTVAEENPAPPPSPTAPASPQLRNPLRSTLSTDSSFSSPLKRSASSVQRRRSLLISIADESFKQVKVLVFLTWDLFLDICAMIILMLMLAYRLRFIKSCQQFHQYIIGLSTTEIDTGTVVERIIRDFSFLNLYLNLLKVISLAAVLLGISHFFMRTSQGKRLGIVTRTITKSLQDLIPLLFIFITLLIAYATLGTEIYGAQLVEWSDLFQSMSTLFIMILGNYDTYDDSELHLSLSLPSLSSFSDL
jgi:hypothetical protein